MSFKHPSHPSKLSPHVTSVLPNNLLHPNVNEPTPRIVPLSRKKKKKKNATS